MLVRNDNRLGFQRNLNYARLAGQGARYLYDRYTAPTSAPATSPYKVSSSKPSYSRGSRGRKKIPRKRKSKIKKIEKDIRSLRKYDKTGMGIHTHRKLASTNLTSSVNAQGWAILGNSATTGNYELALANLKYFDSSTNTLVTADAASGTYSRTVEFKSVGAHLEIRNNYQVPCDYTLYLCKIRDDSSLSASTCWTNGLANDQSNITALTQLGNYPTDYSSVNDIWNLSVSKKGRLLPGETVTASHYEKDISYDPSKTDSHALSYQRELKSFQFLLVIRGIIGHDTVQDEQTLLQAGVDVKSSETWVVQYNAGKTLNRFYTDNGMDTAFTNAGVATNQPVADNQSYSLA